MQPGPELRITAEERQLRPHANEDILRGVVSIYRANETPSEDVNLLRVRAVESLEGVHVAARGLSDVSRFLRLGDVVPKRHPMGRGARKRDREDSRGIHISWIPECP